MKKSVYIPFKKGKGFKDFVAGAGNQIPVVNAVDKKEIITSTDHVSVKSNPRNLVLYAIYEKI